MTQMLTHIADLVWSYPVVGLCLLSALYFTVRLGAIQFRAFPHAIALLLGRYDNEEEEGTISHFQALAAALSGTIGIGNIAGVAIAIAVGGPGAVLWMWLCGLLGMATKFVECTLGTHYRERDPATGETRGGPMYYIVAGLGPRWRPVAVFYALTIAFAGFGFTCMFQSNQAADVLRVHYGVPGWATGVALMVLTGAVIIGGIKSIGRFAASVVPTMCLIYVGGALVICLMHLADMPDVAAIIIRDGLTGEAAAGGSLGAVILWGVRRAIFSNEAGLGSASIAHAAVKTDEPVREGVVASLGPFIDTVIVSGATAFVIVLSGAYGPLRDQAVAPLELAQVGEGWQERAAGASGDPRFIDGATTYQREVTSPQEGADTPEGSAAAEPALAFALEESALTSDALRVPARVEAGALALVLEADGEPIGDVEVLAGSSWNAHKLVFDKDMRAAARGAQLRLLVIPDAQAQGAELWVAAPSVVETRTGISASSVAFDRFIPGFGSIFITFAGFAFALSTMISWSYYGEVASGWVFGARAHVPYRVIFVLLVFVGAVRKLDVIISFSDILIGLLVIPNVIALLVLSPRVAEWTRDYFRRLRAGEFDPN